MILTVVGNVRFYLNATTLGMDPNTYDMTENELKQQQTAIRHALRLRQTFRVWIMRTDQHLVSQMKKSCGKTVIATIIFYQNLPIIQKIHIL